MSRGTSWHLSLLRERAMLNSQRAHNNVSQRDPVKWPFAAARRQGREARNQPGTENT